MLTRERPEPDCEKRGGGVSFIGGREGYRVRGFLPIVKIVWRIFSLSLHLRTNVVIFNVNFTYFYTKKR